ncbi:MULTISPECIES: hypothetical protein [unclassified Streptomyces]|uniref:hypothetical protein n=1 Tax=unclassified Streptomyces TaxID=2593676 RepID=UPI0036ECA33F
MATTDRGGDREGGSGLEILCDELAAYLGAQGEHLVERAGDRLEDVTDQLLDVAENGGSLSGRWVSPASVDAFSRVIPR